VTPRFGRQKLLGLVVALVLSVAQLPAIGLAAGVPSDSETMLAYGHATPTSLTRTVPYFSDSFSYAGTTDPYTMVGTNPRTSQATTKVPVVIVPLRFVFADGSVSDPGTTVSDVLGSPLFRRASFSSGETQYGDATRRAMFWQDVAGTDYHALVEQSRIFPTQTLVVPADQGVFVQTGALIGLPILGTHAAAPTGVVSATWFGNGQTAGAFATLLATLHVDPIELTIVFSRNVVLSTDPIPFGAPILGFHTAVSTIDSKGVQRVRTAIWANYADPYTVQEFPNITQNVDILSHEVSEWLHDPVLSNIVPTWQSPPPLSSFFYGCSNLLETVDATPTLASR
jgi:hypothetical protein